MNGSTVTVIGAGAWGLPAAAELQRRGHRVHLIDRHGPGSSYSSSTGPTRIWRVAHPDAPRTRLALAAAEAFDRVGVDAGRQVHTRQGLLWRDTASLPAIRAALTECSVEFTDVPAADVGSVFRGLRPDDRDAIWQPEAGTVLADAYLRAQFDLFRAAGGRYTQGVTVTEIESGDSGVRIEGRRDAGASEASGGVTEKLSESSDAVVLAAGNAMREWLPALGVDVALRVVLEQVTHVGAPHTGDGPAPTDDLPCLIDGEWANEPGIYSMPTPGVGFKLGHSNGRREVEPGSLDRTPDPRLAELAVGRVTGMIDGIAPAIIDTAACPWTLSPDNRFIIDSLDDHPGVVVAAGCCGEGFKFSALMGQILADQVEQRPVDPDVATFSLDRFADGSGRVAATEHGFGV